MQREVYFKMIKKRRVESYEQDLITKILKGCSITLKEKMETF